MSFCVVRQGGRWFPARFLPVVGRVLHVRGQRRGQAACGEAYGSCPRWRPRPCMCPGRRPEGPSGIGRLRLATSS